MIKLTTHHKRIKNEFLDIIEKYKTVTFTKNEADITVSIDNVIIIITKNYPFKPPTILLNGSSFSNFITPPNSHINALIRIVTEKNECLFCASIIKNDKLWNPTMNILHVMREVDKIKKLKGNVKMMLSIENICSSFSVKIQKYIPNAIEKEVFSYCCL